MAKKDEVTEWDVEDERLEKEKKEKKPKVKGPKKYPAVCMVRKNDKENIPCECKDSEHFRVLCETWGEDNVTVQE